MKNHSNNNKKKLKKNKNKNNFNKNNEKKQQYHNNNNNKSYQSCKYDSFSWGMGRYILIRPGLIYVDKADQKLQW